MGERKKEIGSEKCRRDDECDNIEMNNCKEGMGKKRYIVEEKGENEKEKGMG